ncbi:DUF4870 domain-containing protein [Galactobacter caseinivorans]|nr:DUF4870 domain-containing protein [Galactobacter caseinivorans]
MTSQPDNGRNRSASAGQPTGLSGSAPQALPLTPGEDRRWATMAHFVSLAGFLPSLIIHLVYRDRGPFTAQESREAFNFTLPLSVLIVVSFVLGFIPMIGWAFSLLAVLLWLLMTILGMIAGVQVNKGRPYLYKFNLRMF